jgi:hypothetical protein
MVHTYTSESIKSDAAARTSGMTRAEIEGLKVGDVLERIYPTVNGKAVPGAPGAFQGKIVRIAFRGVSVKGHAYIGGDTAFGADRSTMSFSVSEGEEHVRLVSSEANG